MVDESPNVAAIPPQYFRNVRREILDGVIVPPDT
jgi:hypothetical protein